MSINEKMKVCTLKFKKQNKTFNVMKQKGMKSTCVKFVL